MSPDVHGQEPRRSRRDEYAEQTRQAVVVAARQLFAERGYFATTVNEIAEASRVSPGTVYQQCGGKHGLLRTLMDQWTTSDLVQQTLDDVDAAASFPEVVHVLTESYLQFWRRYDDIVQLVAATAAHDAEATAALMEATERHRSALHQIAGKVRRLGALPAQVSDDDFTDIVLYHFGPQNGFHFTVSVLGWPEQRAREFISAQFTHSLTSVAARPI